MARRITQAKRITAAAMAELGVPQRAIAEELDISKGSVQNCLEDDTLNPAEVERVKEKIAGRFVVAADRFLSHGLSNIQELGPYQAMLCSGIAYDHYLRASQAAHGGNQGGGLTQILILIDQQLRGQHVED